MAIFALIPAAGHSRRMGTPKLQLPLGDYTVLQRVIRTVKQAGVETVLAVLGPHVESLAATTTQAGGEALVLDAATSHMRATIEAGLDYIERQHAPSQTDRWLLCPGDHPVLDAGVIAALIDVLDKNPAATIALPTHHGTRGHPTLISWRHVTPMRAFTPDLGLNAYLRMHPAETVEVVWPNADVLIDLDTPDEYAALQKRFASSS